MSHIIFPFRLENGALIPGTETDSIKDSVSNLLQFPVNRMPFNRGFGSRLCAMQSEPNDNILEGLARFECLEVIYKNEWRLKLLDSRAFRADSKLNLQLRYLVNTTQSIENPIVPIL